MMVINVNLGLGVIIQPRIPASAVARLTLGFVMTDCRLTAHKQGKGMKPAGIAVGVALIVGATIASANVTESQFPPRTVRDLIEICAPAKEDPMMTAAINYCH